MKNPPIVVGEVKIADLRSRLKTLLYMKVPRIVYRNSRPVGILLSVETSWFGRLEHPRSQRLKLHAELDAAIAKVARAFHVE
jgi:hypothetical protein